MGREGCLLIEVPNHCCIQWLLVVPRHLEKTFLGIDMSFSIMLNDAVMAATYNVGLKPYC